MPKKGRSKQPVSKRSPASTASREPSALEQLAPVSAWRDVATALVAFLMVVGISGGLFYWLPWLQIGVAGGVAAALVGRTAVRAGLLGALGATAAVLVGPASVWTQQTAGQRLWQGLALVAVLALSAYAGRAVLGRASWVPRALMAVAIALLVGNYWATTLTVNTMQATDSATGQVVPSMNQQLAGDIPGPLQGSDNALYVEVLSALREGRGYYESVQVAFVGQHGQKPSSVLNYRLPTLAYVWSKLPNGQGVMWAFLILTTCASLCVIPFGSRYVKAPLVVPAIAAMLSYFIVFSTQLAVFSQEPWAVCLGVFAITAFARSYDSSRWLAWTIASVVLATLGTLVRETLVFVPIGAIVASAIFSPEHRWQRVGVWAAGWAAMIAALAVHMTRATGFIDPTSQAGRFGSGSLAFMASAITFATLHLGEGGWLPWALALLGMVGAISVPDKATRTLLLVGTIAPLGAFLVIGNDASYASTGGVVNYWGATVMPLLYLCAPVAFRMVPGMAVERPGAS